MRNRILAVAAIAGAIGRTDRGAGPKRVTTGVVRGNTVVIEQDRRHRGRPAPGVPRICRRATRAGLHVPDRVVVGTVLPETGVTYYDVPQRFGATPYRYTVVNGADRAGRTALASHRSGGRLTSKPPPERSSGRRASGYARERPDMKAPSGLPTGRGFYVVLVLFSPTSSQAAGQFLSRRRADDLLVQQCRRRHQL